MPVSSTPSLSEVRAEISGSYTGNYSLSRALADAGFPSNGSLSLFVGYVHELGVPNITFPDGVTSIPVSNNTVTFTWDSVVGATNYDWELNDNVNGTGFLADSGNVSTNSVTWTPNGGLTLDSLVGGDGSFRVRAKDSSRTGDWSGWVNFGIN